MGRKRNIGAKYDDKKIKIKSFYKEKSLQKLFNETQGKISNKLLAKNLGLSLRTFYRYKSYLQGSSPNKGDTRPSKKRQKNIFTKLKKLAKKENISTADSFSFYDLDIIKRRLKAQLKFRDIPKKGGFVFFLVQFYSTEGSIEKWFTVYINRGYKNLSQLIQMIIDELDNFFINKLSTKYNNNFYKILKITLMFRGKKIK